MPLVSNILGSSVGQKYLMALSGVGLFGFIVVHMLGNLTILAGPAAINEYAAKLHSMGPLLWIARIGLLGMVGVHIWAAVRLTRDNRKARSVQYEGVVDPVDRHRRSKIVSTNITYSSSENFIPDFRKISSICHLKPSITTTFR